MTAETVSLPSRRDIIREHKARGFRVAAVFPIHSPRPLLRAFDVLPVEVWGPPHVGPALGDAHLQAYTCSIVRHGLSFVLSGGLDEADLLLVPHACDSLQGLGSLLLDLVPARRPVLTLYLPRTTGTTAETYLADELRRLRRRLEEWTGRFPTDTELHAAIDADEVANGLARTLLARRAALPLDDRAFYRLLRSREYLPCERFAECARCALASAGSAPAGVGARLPVVLSGIVPEPWELFTVLERAGALVVGDDLAATGRRAYPAARHPDPLVRLARTLLGAPPDPTRGSPLDERIARLRTLARDGGARGVVFYGIRCCEPELFDLPILREALRSEGLPSVHVEVDLGTALPGPIITRIEAFLESIA